MQEDFSFYEFFAGGGMAHLGLGAHWNCLFANDIDPKKASSYQQYFPASRFILRDVAQVTVDEMPGQADLAWASFPCQDLSLAGNGAGLNGVRSGTFWAFWSLVKCLREEGRAPRTIVLENVAGAITSNQGRDLAAICSVLSEGGYRFGPLVIDAVHFLPQSRPRLFIVAVDREIEVKERALLAGRAQEWHPRSLQLPYKLVSMAVREDWIWWDLPLPQHPKLRFSEVIDENPEGVHWHSAEETRHLLGLMSPLNRKKVLDAQRSAQRHVGTLYRRTRVESDGVKRQRAEVRFDDVAGCLRTPSGGSSRQSIIVVEGGHIRTRLLSPREAARLMGMPEDYPLPSSYNDAYHLVGDGVAVPVVRHLASSILEPVLIAARAATAAA